ncbi:MAG: cytochrome c biogenesis protein CcmG/thiol:disulfide interchange protein DsbE [Verrucomicrobiales bacterium]|jgi:cytochrome c biogenesis protein CcmG/thiol:disulfide interchange protein DsbE
MVEQEPVELTMPAGPSRLAFFAAMAFGLVLVVFIAVLATSDGESGIGRSPLISKPAPLIIGEAVDGSSFDLETHRGRWVVVNFFATTCVPCIVEHPELVAFDDAHRPVGDVSVVSIAFSDSSSNVREFFAENGGDWSVLAEDTGRHAIGYGVAAVPETYLVAPSGIITSKFTGGVTQADLDAEIDRLDGAAGTTS